MSDETHANLEAALRAHILDEYDDPRIVTDWVVLSANQGLDGDVTGYFYVTTPGTAAHVITGLLAHFLRMFEYKHSAQGDGR